jgi:ATP-dependent DNA ligase
LSSDVLVLDGREIMHEPLAHRRALLERHVLPALDEPIRYSPALDASLPDLIASVKAQELEGLVAKKRQSSYEPGLRSGAWQKMRINRGQAFVIGGYTIGGTTFNAIVFGYYEDGQLCHAARTRNGFTTTMKISVIRNRFEITKYLSLM